jgi:hypothetical protein
VKAKEQSDKASEYSTMVGQMLEDHCRAAGVSPNKVTPALNVEQIAQVKQFADMLPYLCGLRTEFKEAARMAEDGAKQKEGVPERTSIGSDPRSLVVAAGDIAN